MIFKNEKDTTGVYRGSLVITAVYKGAQLVWQKLKQLGAWFHSEGWFQDRGWFHN